jgi:hypothetical protein
MRHFKRRFILDFKRPPTAAMAADHGVVGLVGGLREPGDTMNPSAREVGARTQPRGPAQEGRGWMQK